LADAISGGAGLAARGAAHARGARGIPPRRRTTLAGTVVSGVVQEFLAAIGHLIAGVPEPAFFGAATAVASCPRSARCWCGCQPACIVLYRLRDARRHRTRVVLADGHRARDYVIRPKLVGDEGTPAILTYRAGGFEIFGLSGLIVGPILMSIAVSTPVLRARDDRRPSRGESGQPVSLVEPGERSEHHDHHHTASRTDAGEDLRARTPSVFLGLNRFDVRNGEL
jgi:hypothetical protein